MRLRQMIGAVTFPRYVGDWFARRRLCHIISVAFLPALVAACGGVMHSRITYASETPLVTMSADLDGSGRSLVITLQESGSGDFHAYELRVDRASATGRFFAADGDKPVLQIVDIDERSDGKELLIKLPGPSDCSYVFYDYRNGLLNMIGTLISDNCSYAPRLTSNGQIVMGSWKGFWERRDIYELDRETHRLELRRLRYSFVGVRATAKRPLEACLVPECAQRVSFGPAGITVEVLLYDSIEMGYLFRTSENVIGWIAEAELQDSLTLQWAD